MPYPPNDGGAIATLNMITGFVNHGDKVTVLAMQTHKHGFPHYDLPDNLKVGINWHQAKVNTKLNPFSVLVNLLFSKKPYNAVRFQSKGFSKILSTILLTDTFDIVQLEGLYLAPYIPLIRKFSNAKIALRAHNIEHEIWERLAQNEKSTVKKYYLKQLAARVKQMEFNTLNEIDLLVPITKRDAEVLCSNDADREFVSPTGIDNDKFKLTHPTNSKSLFYIGALDWMPNTEAIRWFLNKVWHSLQLEFPDWEFVIAGRNAHSSFIHELKSYRVNYVGEVPDSTTFIDEHNIMIVPLLSGSGMRIKIIEGMARGKCIVTTSIGTEGISAKNGSEIFIQNTPDEFKKVLKNLMQNQEQIDRCGKNAFIFVQQHYSNQVIIDKLSTFYAKHLDNT
jgi:glycosyltransferase involved in cell wall biosynthesis